MLVAGYALGAVNGTAKFLPSASVGVVWTALAPEFAFALAAGWETTVVVIVLQSPLELIGMVIYLWWFRR